MADREVFDADARRDFIMHDAIKDGGGD